MDRQIGADCSPIQSANGARRDRHTSWLSAGKRHVRQTEDCHLALPVCWTPVPELAGARLLLGIPEHQVQLEGGGHASQTDLWALLETPVGVVSAAIEAKAGEPFDKSVTEWLEGASEKSGKPVRLQQLCEILRFEKEQAHRCRYQLLHRAVAAILEARRFGLKHAMFLVQSFAADAQSASDFRCFGDQLGVVVGENQIVLAGERSGVQLWVGWVQTKHSDEPTIKAAV